MQRDLSQAQAHSQRYSHYSQQVQQNTSSHSLNNTYALQAQQVTSSHHNTQQNQVIHRHSIDKESLGFFLDESTHVGSVYDPPSHNQDKQLLLPNTGHAVSTQQPQNSGYQLGPSYSQQPPQYQQYSVPQQL